MEKWEKVRRGKPDPAPILGSQGISITVRLEQVPPPEWQRIFNSPSGIMSTACVPKVNGGVIVADSSLGQLRACVEHIDRLIENANERYLTVLQSEERARAKAQREMDEAEQRRQEALKELEGL